MKAKRMTIELTFMGGGTTEHDLLYYGEDDKEIARDIDRDQNDLLHYMLTGDDNGIKSFCFCGFIFKKKGLCAARLYEPEF